MLLFASNAYCTNLVPLTTTLNEKTESLKQFIDTDSIAVYGDRVEYWFMIENSEPRIFEGKKDIKYDTMLIHVVLTVKQK